MPKFHRIGAAIITLVGLAVSTGMAGAEELWAVRSGHAFFHFNVLLLHDIGLEIKDVSSTAPLPDELFMEEPHWAFAIRQDSDFRFRAEHGIALPGGITGGAIVLDAEITVLELATGRVSRLAELAITPLLPGESALPDEDVTPPLTLRSSSPGGMVFFELASSMLDFRRKDEALQIHYLNARISDAWAKALNRPELAGLVVGTGEVRATLELIEATPPSTPPYVPNFEGGFLDVSLGILSGIQQTGHVGTFPTGTAGLSMSTTSCNLGDVDVPWLAPMQEDHPLIHMALYRILNGKLEQIGVSWMKHGFFALSNSQCTPCQHPSGGQFLGVGCSDTYGAGNNSDRNYLGPRKEVNAFTRTWECTGSHFAGGVQDCVRRHGSSGHGAVDHMLLVADADLDNDDATYYYESYYLVRGDQNLPNNWGSRLCTMNWNGSMWQFSTPSSNNPLVEGPAMARLGGEPTYVDAAPGDGRVLVVIKTTPLAGNTIHYEYGLLNMESDRQIRSFSLPVAGVPNIANIRFHDSDSDAGNDWQVTLDNGVITWETSTYAQNPNAHALEFGLMFNFAFDADAKPTAVGRTNATLGLFKPGVGTEVVAATIGPVNQTAAIVESGSAARAHILGIRPNPLNRSATIDFELGSSASVDLAIYDTAGRLVRTLVAEERQAGSNSVVWDGQGMNGKRAHSGVYYARLRAGGATKVKSLVVVN